MTEDQKLEEKRTGSVGDPVKKEVAPRVQVSGDAFAKIVETVSRRMTVGPVPETITEVVKSALDGCLATGGSLVLGAKAIVVGVLRGAGEKEEAGLKTLLQTARTLVRHADSLGSDVAATAKGLVLGAIASAKDLGVDLAKTASTAAQGALEGATEAGSAAADKVRKALMESIGGIKIVLPGAQSR